MDLTALSGVDLMTAFQTPQVASKLTDKSDSMLVESEQQETAFDSVFQSALNLIEETNAYSNAAEEEEIKYALGESDSIHDPEIYQYAFPFQWHTFVPVEFTLDAYKEIMNMQF